MSRPKVSVILTYHNRPRLVKRALRHIICQSYQDFELILVDDCSSETFALDDVDFRNIRVRQIRNTINIGANQSRLKGLRVACGQYICFHDDDDCWMEEKLAKQVDFLDSNLDVVLVTSAALTNTRILQFPSRPSRLHLSVYNCVGSFSLPMIRNVQELADALDNDLSNAQDWHVWRSLEKIGAFATLPEVLVFFDDGPHDRISSVKNKERYYTSYLRVALSNSPDCLIRKFHRSVARYHCARNPVGKFLAGIIYGIFRIYIWIRLAIGRY